MNILVAMPDGEIRNSFIPPEMVEKINALGNVTWNNSEDHFSEAELKEKIKGIDVCITGWSCKRIDNSILENADRLKIIAHTGGTVAPYICEEVFEKGIKVISGNELYAESVAEGTVAYMLCSLRNIVHYNNEVQNGRWRSATLQNEGLLDQTVGLVGYGAITRHVIKMLKPFHCRIKVHSRHMSESACREFGFEKSTLADIFSSCKIISLHNALTPETHHMIGRDLLSMIPDGAILINTARGAIIDEKALEEELTKNRFKAVLDVFDKEPLPESSKLRGLYNCILIPHMGGPTLDRWKVITGELIYDIENFFCGKELKYEISQKYASNMTR